MLGGAMAQITTVPAYLCGAQAKLYNVGHSRCCVGGMENRA